MYMYMYMNMYVYLTILRGFIVNYLNPLVQQLRVISTWKDLCIYLTLLLLGAQP